MDNDVSLFSCARLFMQSFEAPHHFAKVEEILNYYKYAQKSNTIIAYFRVIFIRLYNIIPLGRWEHGSNARGGSSGP